LPLSVSSDHTPFSMEMENTSPKAWILETCRRGKSSGMRVLKEKEVKPRGCTASMP
jgi:hypothetical protein